LFADLAALKRSGDAPTKDSARWDRAVAVGGILQGLLDFREIKAYELADVFADADIDAEGEELRAFHKGTLLALAGEAGPEDERERLSRIVVDPYLAVPNIVLLHNEQRLKKARQRERDLSIRQRDRWRDRAPINDTENGIGEIAGLLAQHLPNVFNYSDERRLQKRGHHLRGLDDLEAFVRLRMDDLATVLQWRVRRRDRSTAVLGIAVGVVTGFLVQQAIEGRPLWAVAGAALALFALFFVVRDRIF
jgi:hypothetical protein